MNYVLVGYGRTGKEIDRRAKLRGHQRTAVIDPAYRGRGKVRRIEEGALRSAGIAFEFTEPSAARENVLALVRAGLSVVCGTTGWTPDRTFRREVESSGRGVVAAPNFSIGMNLFYRVVRSAARAIGAAGLHEPYICETHHRGKADAPSGTARHLASLVAGADPRHPEILAGAPEGRLPENTLHVASVRGGSEPGKHVVAFDGEYDLIELSHSGRGRAGLALGAVLAAEWLEGKTGFHRFDPVVRDLLKEGSRT
jgi:4-hydroxy-tetrahydrodipicolinate reductase